MARKAKLYSNQGREDPPKPLSNGIHIKGNFPLSRR